MDKRGEIGTLNEQITRLMTREKLSEDEVKMLCEKVRREGGEFNTLLCSHIAV
jgi:hypothetical protein